MDLLIKFLRLKFEKKNRIINGHWEIIEKKTGRGKKSSVLMFLIDSKSSYCTNDNGHL